MTSPRTLARIAGAAYLVTHVTSVAAVVLYGPGGTTAGAPLAGRTSVLLGGLLEVVLAVAVVGTAVALYPLVRTRGPATATAYVGLRTLEAAVILTGVVALLPVVAAPGASGPTRLDEGVAAGLELVHAWSFLVGPGLVVPVHTVLLARLLLRERLVPRPIAILGLVGGPLIGGVNLLVLLGVTGTIWVAALPIFAWEVGLAVHLLVRGLPAAPVPDAGPRPVLPAAAAG